MRLRKSIIDKEQEENSVQLDTSASSVDSELRSVDSSMRIMKNTRSFSLGTGQVDEKGKVSFHPSCRPRSIRASDVDSLSSSSEYHHDDDGKLLLKKSSSNSRSATKKLRKRLSTDKILSPVRDISDKLLRPVKFDLKSSCYLRVADLKMSETSHSAVSDEHEEVVPNFHHASVRPPPGVQHDPKETWVAIDTGEGSHAPIAPIAIESLSHYGTTLALDQSMWTADRKTDKLVKHCNDDCWYSSVWSQDGCVVLPPRGFAEENEVLVWTGEFKHGLYGSDLPAIRAAGIIGMSAKSLMELLTDSSRVKEYNPMSLGRTDLIVMPGSLDEEGPFGKSITKVLKSESCPPFLRKTLQFVSVMHAKELPDGSGYLLVTRAVTHADHHGVLDPSILHSEILTSVNLIRKVAGDDNRCLMINVNHIRSPMVPMMIAKRISLSAASNFFHDLRALCS